MNEADGEAKRGAGDGWGEVWVSADFDAAGSASGGPRTHEVRS